MLRPSGEIVRIRNKYLRKKNNGEVRKGWIRLSGR